MADARQPPEQPVLSDDLHPTEPAEGADDPGADADTGRPPHPDEPAEGER